MVLFPKEQLDGRAPPSLVIAASTKSAGFPSVSGDPSTKNAGLRSLIWPALFTVGFIGSCFGLVSVSVYHDLKGDLQRLAGSAPCWARSAHKKLEGVGPAVPLLGPLIGINVGVWGWWKVLGPNSVFMRRYFMHTAGQGRALPMLLSTFSHIGVFHLVGNMIGLLSFGSAVAQVIGMRDTAAVYFSTGVAAQFVSACFAVLSKRPIVPSVGASGGVLGLASIWGYVCPESQLYLIFFPLVTFSAKNGLIGIACFDVVGLARGWRIIDHAAHLGGLGLGLAIIHDLYQGKRSHVMKYEVQTYWWYHNLLQREGETTTKAIPDKS